MFISFISAPTIRRSTDFWRVNNFIVLYCIAGFECNKVTIKTYYFSSRQIQVLEIRDDELQSIQTDAVTIDMPTGRITYSGPGDAIAESLAWSFCVGYLYVVAQRSSIVGGSAIGLLNNSAQTGSRQSDSGLDSSPTASVSKKSRFSVKSHMLNKKMSKRRKMSASFTFLLACGLQIDAALYSPSSNGAAALLASASGLVKSASAKSRNGDPQPHRLDPVDVHENGSGRATEAPD